MRAPAIPRGYEWKKPRPCVLCRLPVGRVETRVVVRAVDVAADAVADGAADQHVAEEMIAAREARDADRRGEPVSTHLHEAAVPVFVSDDRGERPRAGRVPRRE